MFENGWILKGTFNGLVVETWTVDTKGRGMFVLTVEYGAIKCGLKLVDRGLCNMVGDLLGVFGPKVVA